MPPACDFSTFFTIFCSSMRNARTTRDLTQLAQREPPYARATVRWRLATFLKAIGRMCLICGGSSSGGLVG